MEYGQTPYIGLSWKNMVAIHQYNLFSSKSQQTEYGDSIAFKNKFWRIFKSFVSYVFKELQSMLADVQKGNLPLKNVCHVSWDSLSEGTVITI